MTSPPRDRAPDLFLILHELAHHAVAAAYAPADADCLIGHDAVLLVGHRASARVDGISAMAALACSHVLFNAGPRALDLAAPRSARALAASLSASAVERAPLSSLCAWSDGETLERRSGAVEPDSAVAVRFIAAYPAEARGARMVGIACAIMGCYLLDPVATGVLDALDAIDAREPGRVALVRLSEPVLSPRVVRALVEGEPLALSGALDAARAGTTRIAVREAEAPV